MNDASTPLLQAALAMHRQGAMDDAAMRYREVLALDPQNADAYYYLALISCQGGRFAEGADLVRRAIAIAPQQARAHDLLGKALSALGQRVEAISAFERAIACDPAFAAAHGNRANLLSELGRHSEALTAFDKALALDPNAAEDWCNRGATLRALARNAEAVESYERALALAPGLTEAHVNRASLLKDLGRVDEALAGFDHALALQHDFAEAHAGRSVVLGLLNRHDEAVASAERAVALRPDLPPAIFARAMALKEAGRIAEARADFDHAARLAPADDDIAFARSMLQLLQGDLREAWPNFERRRQHSQPLFSSGPRWLGEPFQGQLVLSTEQGLGDAIQFARYVPILAERGYRVSILTNAALAPLLRSLPGVESVTTEIGGIVRAGEPHRWAPLLSVPAILQTDLVNVPVNVPYLVPDPARVESWAAQLGRTGLRIGIAWQGNPEFSADKGRSIPLSAFAPLAGIAGVRLISLQKHPGYEQAAGVDFRDRIETPIDPSDRSADSLLDTAALIGSLDLVITSDTMLAHLSGALACPTFVALRRVPDWRWLLDREDNPWYPTLRLFRQTTEGDWTGVFSRIAAAIRERVPQS